VDLGCNGLSSESATFCFQRLSSEHKTTKPVIATLGLESLPSAMASRQ